MIPGLIDTHFHLDFYKNHKEVYDKINELQQYTLCMTNSPGVYLSCKSLYSETKYLKFALGFHPQETSLGRKEFSDFMRMVNSTNYIGEIGLDFTKESEFSQNKQCIYFEKIVEVCSKKNKVMSVHLRKSEDDAIRILKKYHPKKCIIHWFNGNEEQLKQLVELDCYFSINANMLSNEKNHLQLRMIPHTKILIESDGPFSKVKGKKYSVGSLYDIYEAVARFYDQPNIINVVYSNFKDLLLKSDI